MYTPGPALPRWIAVRQRFVQFHHNLALTPSQHLDGNTKRANVVRCLNRAYYGTSSDTDNSFLVGSWGKGTATRPPRDVDVYFLLPHAVYCRFQGYTGNRQSALLQEVKDKLAANYPNTTMRGDGQVVMVNFASYNVEIVPAIRLVTPSRYWICDTHNGGSYKETAPWDEARSLETSDAMCAGNLRPLIRMMKAWQAYCSVPLKSFHLELLAATFLQRSPWRLRDWFYFDWITGDFFAFLTQCGNATLFVPGTYEAISLGNAWLSRAESAYCHAAKACWYEYENHIADAGDEWQAIFGPYIPKVP